MTLSLLRCRAKSRNFVYATGRNEENSRDFVNAMQVRARDAVISIACKGSSAVNVVHTRAQKFCNFQGSCGACEGSKCCNFQGLNINSQDFPHARAQHALISKVLCMQGLKMQLFRESLCMQELKVLQFPGFCDFQGFCMQGSIYCNFLGFCACRSSTCFTFQGSVHEKGSKCCSKCFTFQGFRARKGSTCFNFLFRKLPDNWAPKKGQNDNKPQNHLGPVNNPCLDQLITIKKPNLDHFNFQELCEKLQVQSQNALIAKDSNVLSSKSFACIIGALVGFTGLVPKTAILGKFWSRRGRPSCQYSLLIFTEHIPGEEEYWICINMRLHILFRENIICIIFRLDGTPFAPPLTLPPFYP